MSIKDHLGHEFNTATEMCEHYGISERCFNSRVNKLNWDIKKALTTPIKGEKYTKSVLKTKDGRTFSSLRQAEKETGVPRATIAKRLNDGLSLDEALALPTIGGPKKFVDHKGIEYSSIAEAGRAYGISSSAILQRLKYGHSLEEALTSPIRQNNKYKKGEKVEQRNGQIAKITEIYGARGTILFEDGTEIKNIALSEFRRGNIRNPNYKKTRVGEKRMSNCGLMMEIIEDNNKKNITVKFEDGAVRKGISYWSFKVGKVSHPTFCADSTKPGTFMGFKVRALPMTENGDIYYETEDIVTKEKNIMTPKQMIERRNNEK